MGKIEEIAKMLHEEWEELNKESYKEDIKFLLTCDYKMEIAKEGKKYAGFILHRKFPGKIRHIVYSIVKKEFRGKGYGKFLLEKVEKYAKVEGDDFIFIETDKHSNWEFYVRMGYKKIWGLELYFPDESKGKEPLYVFVKTLDKNKKLTNEIVKEYYYFMEKLLYLEEAEKQKKLFDFNRRKIEELKQIKLITPKEL